MTKQLDAWARVRDLTPHAMLFIQVARMIRVTGLIPGLRAGFPSLPTRRSCGHAPGTGPNIYGALTWGDSPTMTT